MRGIIAFVISGLMGYFLLKCFKRENRSFHLTDAFLSMGLGLGLSSEIVFYSLLLRGQIDPVSLLQAHLFCLGALFLYGRRYSSSLFSFSLQTGWVCLVLSIVLFLAVILSICRPWGDWDAWSFWNYHANFISRSAEAWPRLFDFNIQAHHPWMLPLLIIWGWSCNGGENTIVPALLGVIFTVLTVGLLIASLKKYIPFFWALLGGVFLASLPVFVLHGTSQYADIEAAFFILLSSILALDLLMSPSIHLALLTGLCMGLSACVKDNSLTAALMLIFILMVHLFRSGAKKFIKPLGLGFLIIAESVFLMKYFDRYYPVFNSYEVIWSGLSQAGHWILIGKYVLKVIFSYKWGGLWFLFLIILILRRKYFHNGATSFLLQFTGAYFIFNIFVFAISALDLQWLLDVSFYRMLYLIAPTSVFILFLTLAQKE